MTKYGQAPVPMLIADLPPVNSAPERPSEISVMEHRVGYTEVVLSNGDKIRCHLFVQRFVYDAGGYTPEFRVVQEVVARGPLEPEVIAAITQDAWSC